MNIGDTKDERDLQEESEIVEAAIDAINSIVLSSGTFDVSLLSSSMTIDTDTSWTDGIRDITTSYLSPNTTNMTIVSNDGKELEVNVDGTIVAKEGDTETSVNIFDLLGRVETLERVVAVQKELIDKFLSHKNFQRGIRG